MSEEVPMTQNGPGEPEEGHEQIPIYSRGTWTIGPYPIPDSPISGRSYEEFKQSGGYGEFTDFGRRGTGSLSLSIWRGEPTFGTARFLLEVETPIDGATIGATDIADLMDLLARWAPAFQAAAIGDFAEDASFSVTGGTGMEFNRFAAIGALLAQGAEDRGEWARRQRDQATLRREQAKAERAARRETTPDDRQ